MAGIEDAFHRPLHGVRVLDPAAYLAGLTVNLWKSREELAAHWQLDRRFEPRMDRKEAQAKMARWREAVARSRGWAKISP